MSHWANLSGRARQATMPAVWDMVQATYAKIGLIVDQPRELYEYDDWELYDDGGDWIAFVLNKTTPFGRKLGLAGSDGSQAGRSAVRAYIADTFFNDGRYGEVSHRMEDLAHAVGVPVVCSAYARDVLKKSIEPTSDGIHYRRAIKGVGETTKVIIGRPLSIPVTTSTSPQCPVPKHMDHSRRQNQQPRAIDRSNDAVFSHALSIINL